MIMSQISAIFMYALSRPSGKLVLVDGTTPEGLLA